MLAVFREGSAIGRHPLFDRSSLASAEKVASNDGERLKLRVPVLLFPEGTSTDGATVLRFHSRLFEPAILAGAPITAASVRYVIEDGTPERELCWYGDETFANHLVKTLNSARISAEVRFGEPRVYAHRRVAADETHDEVAAMRDSGTGAERRDAVVV